MAERNDKNSMLSTPVAKNVPTIIFKEQYLFKELIILALSWVPIKFYNQNLMIVLNSR